VRAIGLHYRGVMIDRHSFVTLALVTASVVAIAAEPPQGSAPQSPQKQQVVALLKSIETGDAAAIAAIDPNKYTQHNLAAADGLAGFGALMATWAQGLSWRQRDAGVDGRCSRLSARTRPRRGPGRAAGENSAESAARAGCRRGQPCVAVWIVSDLPPAELDDFARKLDAAMQGF
jgi:hypothetical protein